MSSLIRSVRIAEYEAGDRCLGFCTSWPSSDNMVDLYESTRPLRINASVNPVVVRNISRQTQTISSPWVRVFEGELSAFRYNYSVQSEDEIELSFLCHMLSKEG